MLLACLAEDWILLMIPVSSSSCHSTEARGAGSVAVRQVQETAARAYGKRLSMSLTGTKPCSCLELERNPGLGLFRMCIAKPVRGSAAGCCDCPQQEYRLRPQVHEVDF